MKMLVRALLACSLILAARGPANATVYHGFPHLHLTMAVVDAGGGTDHFDSHRLMAKIAGPAAARENAKLRRQFGAARVESYYAVFTFAVNDAVKKAHNMLIPLPKSAMPDPKNGPAVGIALYQAGKTPSGRYDVGYMLEMLMSHQIHHDIMGDMDKRFTPAVNAEFHVILTAAMHDIGREYSQV